MQRVPSEVSRPRQLTPSSRGKSDRGSVEKNTPTIRATLIDSTDTDRRYSFPSRFRPDLAPLLAH